MSTKNFIPLLLLSLLFLSLLSKGRSLSLRWRRYVTKDFKKPISVVKTSPFRRSVSLISSDDDDATVETPIKKTSKKPIIQNAHSLRTKVLDEKVPLKDLNVQLDVGSYTVSQMLSHEVLQILSQRFKEQSTPGFRKDDHHVALAIEGGGMRGSVSAGMAAAIASLGLADAVDSIYGSSAGSVVGAYLVSRQMCMDVYVNILTNAKRQFVCTRRLVRSLAAAGVDMIMPSELASRATPGMNISFVLDGIMDHEHGIRPLDLERFMENNVRQPLRIASSYSHNGTLGTRAFGTHDFHDRNLYKCLQASMTVPGATGPPVKVPIGKEEISHFDAFCFEPLPYRSAVQDGATHVLCLCSRPEGFQPKCVPGVYELGIAPLYFKSHGMPEAVSFFDRGGQQYIYAEDLLTLEEGKRAGIQNTGPVVIPPPEVLYGGPNDSQNPVNRDNWNQAHVFPLKVPMGTPELPTLEQDKEAVLEAVRGGYAAAFDLLAPVIGLDIHLTGEDVAQMIFPNQDTCGSWQEQLWIKGDAIPEVAPKGRQRVWTKLLGRFRAIRIRRSGRLRSITRKMLRRGETQPSDQMGSMPMTFANVNAQDLLEILPGFQAGKMSHLAAALLETRKT